MQLRYALYERTQAGYGWTWRAESLSDALLDDFRYRIAVPDDSNSIRPEQLRGGICRFDGVMDGAVQEHVVLYRFFDGGSDAGRPNRVVMLTAWIMPDQVVKLPSRYGVTAILRNQVFEYVSNNARAVGITPPPFCPTLSASEEIPASATRRMPASALMEFMDSGLVDPDNNYYVTIRDNEYSLQRKPSASFGRKEKERQAYENQRLAAERARVEQEATSRKAVAKEQERERQVAARAGSLGGTSSSDGEGRGFVMKIGITATALMLCAVIGLGFMRSGDWWGWGKKTLSAEAEAVLRQFKDLQPDEQRTVLGQLSDWVEQRQLPQNRPSMPVDPGRGAEPRQPTPASPKQVERREIRPSAGEMPQRNPGVDQGVSPQPVR
jgi:hypothetical protein